MKRLAAIAVMLSACGASAQLVDPCTVEPYKRMPWCRARSGGTCTATPYATNFAVLHECTCDTSLAAGNHSEAVTDNRDGGAYCTIGDWLNNIDTGDMVFCPTNGVRAMSGDGTTIGFLSEGGMHNYVDSQDFTAGSWSNTGTGGLAAPVVSNPDAGPCPDGTNRATRMRFPANTLSPAQQSVVYGEQCQGGNGIGSLSVYLRAWGFNPDGGANIAGVDAGTDLYIGGNRRHFTYSVNAWTRWVYEAQTMADKYAQIGNQGYYTSPQLTEQATDMLVCFAQCETSNHTTSYHPTDRDADRIGASIMLPLQSDLLMSGTVLPEETIIGTLATVGYDYATWLGGAVNADGGFSCRNQWSSIDDYVPDTGKVIGTYSRLTPYTFACGWEPVSLVANAVPEESWPGIVDACLNSSCVDGGHEHNPLQSISANYELVEFGGHQTNVDWNSQPDAIIKGLAFSSQAHKTIFLYGDSIVGGAHAEETIHNMLWLRSGAQASVQNHAQSGYTIEQCKTAWDATIQRVREHPTVACSTYMMLQCGTNSPDDAGYVLGLVEQMLLDGQDAGVHVCGSTITPRDDHCPYVTAFNAGLRAWGPQHRIPVAETYTPLWVGPQCQINSDYSSDSLHPNDAGTVIMTNVWINSCGW